MLRKEIDKRSQQPISKPGHIVIGTVRDRNATKAEELKTLPTASGSGLLLVGIENMDFYDPKKAFETIEAAGIDHIDTVIANSGVSIGAAPLELADPKYFTESFSINAVSTVVLYQALSNLLKKSSFPKWSSISSRVGFTSAPLPFYPYAAAYGMSRAAQNWFTQYVHINSKSTRPTANPLYRTLHISNEVLTTFAIYPG
jgi:NAD(P)-dependent dehydrogenase (short-subunit alcohol dehydrogenase family)